MARLGVFLALGVALHVLEAQFPSLPLPGAKLGLANLVSLVALFLWGPREAFLLAVLRQVLGSLVLGTFLAAPFWFGLAGGVTSVAVMAAFKRLAGALFSPVGLSLAGAAAHNLGQLLVAWAFTGQRAVMAYLPILLLFSLPAGALVGLAARQILEALETALIMAPQPQPARSRSRLGLRPADWAAALGLALAAALLLWNTLAPPTAAGEGAAVAVITVGDQVVAELPLDREAVLPLDAGRVHLVLETAPGRVRVRTADCPDQVCVLTGWISRTGQSIVCLPGRTVIRVAGGPELPYDAVTQ
ncbi:MAG TPA: Gx transporter family protein [Limnochorda sp.]